MTLSPFRSWRAIFISLLIPGFCTTLLALGPETTAPDLTSFERVLYVHARTVTGDEETGTLDAPHSTLTAALRNAEYGGPTAILVAAGTYKESPLLLPADVSLFGGYDPSTWKRNILASPTRLDGRAEQRILVIEGNGIVDGFHIENGKVAGYGAGILCNGSSPVISNNFFLHNRILPPPGWNPKNRHELAFDGAAIACLNGSSPVIEKNVFAYNETVIGRGAAIAAHLHADPRIVKNVIMHNVVGTDDPMRSSEGAISAYGFSNPLIQNNLVAMNRAENANDAGGIFIALWANPVIRENWILGNYCDDDGAGLFLGGQEHRYDTPFDPVPPPEQFNVLVERNIFMGNRNRMENSGAMRITMETRARLINNLIARNPGGVYLQRSELEVFHNTIDDPFLMIETKHTIGPSDVQNNLILGTADIRAPTRFVYNSARNFTYGEGNRVISDPPSLFRKDALNFPIMDQRFHPARFQTRIDLFAETTPTTDLSGRIIRVGEFWSLVQRHEGLRIHVWGKIPDRDPLNSTSYIEILSTYRLAEDSIAQDQGSPDTGVRVDLFGNPRPDPENPQNKPDLGAIESIANSRK